MLQIKNWSSYQSYKDRRPPWIRFHRTMLDNYDFQSMSMTAKALLPMFWLLASENEDPTSGIILDDLKRISFRLRCREEEVMVAINECVQAGFLQVIENAACIDPVHESLRIRSQTVHTETETETETKTETETENIVKKPSIKKVSLSELSVDHIKDWLAEKRMHGKYIHHDEQHILDIFKNYCESKGIKYANYIAAYRNAFEWKQFQQYSGYNARATADDNWTAGAARIIFKETGK